MDRKDCAGGYNEMNLQVRPASFSVMVPHATQTSEHDFACDEHIVALLYRSSSS